MLKRIAKPKVKKTHIENLKKWNYDKVKGRLFHQVCFFSIEIFCTNAGREVNKWDQPFIKQNNLVGGIIGLVRTKINDVPHYLVEATMS